jgi:hypothetical protein
MEDIQMGYTNYTNQSKDFTDKEWASITTDVRKLYENLPAVTPDKGIPGAGGEVLKIDDQEGNPPVADDKAIFFNGAGFPDADHETFELTKRKCRDGFSFCKTARKPYDLAAQACMLIAFYHAPQAIKISSDGDAYEWTAAANLLTSIEVPMFTVENCARLAADGGKDTLVKEIAVLILKEANNVPD